MIWTTLIFLITISLLVTVHEFGHFIIARLCGVKVECFSIGFGKKLFSRTSKKGTEYTVSMIPLGGYVKMLDGRNSNLLEEDKKFAFDHKTIIQRAAIISAGPIANFILAFILYWIIFQIGVVTYPARIERTIPNTPASSVNIPQDAELKFIAGIKIESWSDASSAIISEMGKDFINIEYEVKNEGLHSTSINIKNWQFDIEKESPISALGFVPADIEVIPVISKVIPNSAAENAGIKEHDRIIAYNDKPYQNWNDFSESVRKGKPIKISLERDNNTIVLHLTPKIEVNDKGEKIGVIGIYPSNNTSIKQYDIVSGFVKGIERTGLTIKLVVRSFYQLATGVIGLKNLSGPVTIAQGAGQTASYGFVPYLMFLAFISISLGVMNLIPLPMLDGGHLLFLLIEKIKGSPVSDVTQEKFYRLGFFFLIVIMGIAFFNDFIRLSL